MNTKDKLLSILADIKSLLSVLRKSSVNFLLGVIYCDTERMDSAFTDFMFNHEKIWEKLYEMEKIIEKE